eukprot:1146189-Pelagomonas_calceolata.AAC.2
MGIRRATSSSPCLISMTRVERSCTALVGGYSDITSPYLQKLTSFPIWHHSLNKKVNNFLGQDTIDFYGFVYQVWLQILMLHVAPAPDQPGYPAVGLLQSLAIPGVAGMCETLLRTSPHSSRQSSNAGKQTERKRNYRLPPSAAWLNLDHLSHGVTHQNLSAICSDRILKINEQNQPPVCKFLQEKPFTSHSEHVQGALEGQKYTFLTNSLQALVDTAISEFRTEVYHSAKITLFALRGDCMMEIRWLFQVHGYAQICKYTFLGQQD